MNISLAYSLFLETDLILFASSVFTNISAQFASFVFKSKHFVLIYMYTEIIMLLRLFWLTIVDLCTDLLSFLLLPTLLPLLVLLAPNV